MQLKPVEQYLELINEFHKTNNLTCLSEIDDQATVAFGYMSILYGQLEVKEQVYHNMLIENSKSKLTNVALHRGWALSPDGAAMIKLKRDIQALEAILKWIKNKLVALTVEKRETTT